MIVPDQLSLDLPADPAQIGTARAFAARVGGHLGVDEETVEDIKLAVSEACTEAIALGVIGLHLLVSVEPGAITFELEGQGVRDPRLISKWFAEPFDGPARLELVRSLFPNSAVVSEREPFVLRFSVPAPATPTA